MSYDPARSRLLIKHTDNAGSRATLAEVERANQLASADDAVSILRRWKDEHLAVESWWKVIDDYVRAHPEAKLGGIVAQQAIDLLRSRDAMKKAIALFKTELATLPDIAVSTPDARLLHGAIHDRFNQLFPSA